jgi:DNA-binding response OmpR family regulator
MFATENNLSTMKIIHVEDDATMRLSTKKVLQEIGFSIMASYSDAVSAITGAKMLKPDLILMDISLEGDKDGIETFASIKDFSQAPVIYLTSSTDLNLKKKALNIGYLGFLAKPFDKLELARLLVAADKIRLTKAQ